MMAFHLIQPFLLNNSEDRFSRDVVLFIYSGFACSGTVALGMLFAR